MLKKILLALIFVITAITNVTHAEDDMKTVASKAYVDTKIETKQLKIPAAGQPNVGAGETVMTYTSTGNGQIGERGLYSDISSYNATTDGDKLITASALNATFTNLPTTPTTKLECANQADGCTLWTIVDQTAYGRGLPDGYMQRQYIYMMAGSYLLTDIVPTYDCKVEMDFQTTSLPSSSVYLLGGRTETFGGLFFVKTSAGVFMVDAFGNTSDERYFSSVTAQNNTRYKFTYNNQVATLESGGTTLFTNTSTSTLANGAALCINGLNTNGSITTTNTGIYLYSFKVWNGQGELVIDLVPAIQQGTVPVVGFYDMVSGTFKTATAGTFAADPEAN